ncbi:flagellar biosynthesis repressor FlbT [Litorimonas haliclonae]|uniref:flagellar biosynthesis repressor FlbT n=1 Tax=Litorimonas haliclonae TaxID=2081977 RepID=UPI0039EE7F4B
MSGLVISLKPNEKFLVNGALLMNGSKRSQICLPDDDVYVLRLSDALHPNEVNSPVRRVYYAVQLILSGDNDAIKIEEDVRSGLLALEAVFEGTPLSETLEKAKIAFLKGHFYSVLNNLKSLFPIEDAMLNAVSDPSKITEEFNEADGSPALMARAS